MEGELEELNEHKSNHILLKVLFVDDEVLSRAIAERHLNKLGCCINFAERGEEAIKSCEKNIYDLVFLDFYLPDMNATNVIGEIKKSLDLHDAFIVGITNDGSSVCRDAFAEVGVTEVLEKPMTLAVLEKIISRIKATKLDLRSPHN